MTDIWNQSFSLSPRSLIATLMKEIETVLTEKQHFDNRDELFSITTVWNFWTIKILMQGWLSKVFQVEPTSKGIRFAIVTLLEEIRPVVIEKNEIEYRQK